MSKQHPKYNTSQNKDNRAKDKQISLKQEARNAMYKEETTNTETNVLLGQHSAGTVEKYGIKK